MQERYSKIDSLREGWESVRLGLDIMESQARRAVDSKLNALRYLVRTTRSERDQGLLMEAVFINLVMAFLKDHLIGLSTTLELTENQVKVFQLLIDSFNDESLTCTNKSEGRVWSGGRPLVVSKYTAVKSTGLAIVGPNNIVAHFISRWGVREPFLHGFAVFGNTYLSNSGVTDFVALPTIPHSSEEVRELLGIPELHHGFVSKISVHDEGRKIIVSTEGTSRGESIVMTDQYHLVGDFGGEEIGQTYWLYGTNKAMKQ